MNKPKIYLGGEMSGLTFSEMNNWRMEVFKKFLDYNVHIENPCLFYNFEIDRANYTDKEVKEFDLWLVKNCDIVIINLDYPDSIGSAIEIHEAHDNWNKPVIGFGGKDKFVHPWMELSLTKRCETMDDAVEHIINFYLPNL